MPSSSSSYFQFLHGPDPLERLAARAAAKDENLIKKQPAHGWISQQSASQTGCLVFWTQEGTRRCIASGFLGWQCFAVPGDVRVREVQLVGEAYFSDRHQLICAPQDVRDIETMSLAKFLEKMSLPLIHRVFVYVTRESKAQDDDVLVYSLNPEQSDVRIPGAEFQPNEHPCEATFRILNEQSGLDSQVEFRKLGTVYGFDMNSRMFQALHYFQTPVYTALPEQWQHAKPSVSSSKKVAHTFSWMRLPEAKARLSRLQGAKLHMLEAKH